MQSNRGYSKIGSLPGTLVRLLQASLKALRSIVSSNGAFEGIFYCFLRTRPKATDDTCVTLSPLKMFPERLFHGVSKTAPSKRTLPLFRP